MKKTLGFLVLLLGCSAHAGDTADLVKRLGQFEALSGSFEQIMLDKSGTRLRDESGTMDMARGNRFRWHTQEPYEQLAISDGQTVWFYEPDLEQVVVRPLGENLTNTPALLFGGDPARVSEAFTVKRTRNTASEQVYQLSPKLDDSLFSVLEVTFENSRPASMRLEDALGQQTLLTFRELTINGSIPAERFAFVIPDGVDVIRQDE